MQVRKLFFALMILSAGGILTASENRLEVKRNGVRTVLRSRFSGEYTLEQHFYTNGPNRQFNFAPCCLTAPGKQKLPLSASGDDSTPWNFNGTYIGANHGDFMASRLEFPETHGLTVKDTGSEWTDPRGRRFYILKVENERCLWVISENLGKGDIWRFVRPEADGLKNASGKALNGYRTSMQQLRPAVRITGREYLADGKPLGDSESAVCDVFTVRETYDILATDSILAHVRKNAGRESSFIDPAVDKVLTQSMEYQFYPDGSCIVTHRARFFRDVRLGYMGFIQAGPMNYTRCFERHTYYIPKIRPFTVNGILYDFGNGVDYSKKLPHTIYFKNDSFADPGNPPDRFLQYVEGAGKPEVGFAIGYAVTEGIGMAAVRKNNIARSLFLYTSNKTYPIALDGVKMPVIKSETEFYCMAYRQYFDASRGWYANRQGKDKIYYVDFREPVSGRELVFPDEAAGKKPVVLEKTDSLKMMVSGKAALRFTCPEKNSYAVLKFQ